MHKRKKANQVSHRYNCLPLLPSGPGGVRQELVVLICRCKGRTYCLLLKGLNNSFVIFIDIK